MKFSTRTTYGLRAMIQLAQQYGQGCLSAARIAEDEGISPGYLERLLAKLKQADLIEAEKGASGGYRLSRPPKKISVFEIIRPLEGKLTVFHCLDEQGKIFCDEKCRCGVVSVLTKVQSAVNNTLEDIYLSDLVKP